MLQVSIAMILNNPRVRTAPATFFCKRTPKAMGNAFLYYGSLSSCAPNLDIPGLWDLTNACGFPPGDDGPDLVATFNEWDVSGTGEITWNDFVREMTTRINDPGHFDADPLPQTIDMISIPDAPLGDGYKAHMHMFNASDDDYEEYEDSGAPAPAMEYDMYAAFTDGSWKDVLAGVEPTEDGGRNCTVGLPVGIEGRYCSSTLQHMTVF